MASDFRKPLPRVSLRADVPQRLSASLLRAGVPPVAALELRNNGGTILRGAKLRLTSTPEVFPESILDLPDIASRGTFRTASFPVRFTATSLTPGGPDHATLTLVAECDGETTPLLTRRVALLPYDWWVGLEYSPESAAAFVRPADTTLCRILENAGLPLGAGDAYAGFDAFDGPDRLTRLALDVVEALREYMVRVTPSGDAMFLGQRVEPHGTALDSGETDPLTMALLLAAGFEAVGLHPLLIFTREAVLAGCRLDTALLPEPLTRDPSFRRQVEEGGVLLVDPVVAAMALPDAVEHARQTARYALEESFACAVDITRARLTGITPLPGDPAAFRMDFAASGGTAPPLPAYAEAKLEAWPRKLLDLSLRNTMLNFHPGGRYVPLMSGDPGKLEDALADGTSLRVESVFSALAAQESAPETVPVAELEKRFAHGELERDELFRIAKPLLVDSRTRRSSTRMPARVLAAMRSGDLDRRLVQLYRASRLALEEGGMNTLFMVFGFLRWQPLWHGGASETCLAPLLLVPVRLVRERASGAFMLEQTDDAPRFNLALLELLRRDYGITALDTLEADIPADLHGVDIVRVLNMTATAIAAHAGWEVTHDVGLGLFSFAKHLMWKDLVENRDLLASTPVIRHLAMEGRGPDLPDLLLPDAAELESLAFRNGLYCPLPADSSQLAAVSAALSCKSFIMVGPPGTGKSQTIANMIAQCMAHGKTVLFVAEKKAALDVVHSRLRRIGLGDMCLELHSSKARKADVLRQLGGAALATGHFPEGERNLLLGRFDEAAGRLNACARAVTQRHQEGISAAQGVAACALGMDIPELAAFTLEPESDTREASPPASVPLSTKTPHLERNPYTGNLTVTLRREDAPAVTLDSSVLLTPYPHEDEPAEPVVVKVPETVEPRREGLRYKPHSDVPPLLRVEILARAGTGITDLYATGLRYLRRGDWSPSMQCEIAAEATALAEQAEALAGQVAELAQLFKVDVEEAARNIHLFDELADLLLSLYATPFGFIQRPDLPQLSFRMRQVLKILKQFAELRKRLTGDYKPEVFQGTALRRDAVLWNAVSRAEKSVWLHSLWWNWRTVANRLALYCRNGKVPEDEGDDIVHLRQIIALQEEIETLGREDFASLFPTMWKGLQTNLNDWQTITHFSGKVQDLVRRWKGKNASSDRLFRRFAGRDPAVAPDGRFGKLIQTRKAMLGELAPRARAFALALGGDRYFLPCDYAAYAQSCREIAGAGDAMRVWCAWISAREQAGRDLAPVADALEQGAIKPEDAVRSYTVSTARRLMPRLLEEDSVLVRFRRAEVERDIRRLNTASASLRAISVPAIRSRRNAPDPASPDMRDELRLLRRELMKKARHLPIRQLLPGVPKLLRSLTPCLFMSPLSVAQYLAPTMRFDVVIFDEASQIPAWDALGALARGGCAVIAGDPKQLPPTSFFQRVEGDTADDTQTAPDQESLLKQCMASGMPEVRLSWHYRSRNEGLIAFSNRRYYDNALITFPAAAPDVSAITLHRVNGVYGRGSSRTNPVEAQTLVAHLRDRLERCLKEKTGASIGVVTFNAQQQQLVENLLDLARRDNPRLDRFFNSEAAEPVIVKNLENIQGDERDCIYFSIGFGPDRDGSMTMNFGALGADGGERRLNVAVTRARREMHVFASFGPESISLERTGSEGVRDLKAFLEYARSGGRDSTLVGDSPATENGVWENAFPHLPPHSSSCSSRFADVVAAALTRKGWTIRTDVGFSAGRVDLAVCHPDDPDRYLAGILCDDSSSLAFPSAQDREDVRPGVLESLGWNLIRAWCMAWWFAGEDAETARIDGILRELRRAKPGKSAADPATEEEAPASGDVWMPTGYADGETAAASSAEEGGLVSQAVKAVANGLGGALGVLGGKKRGTVPEPEEGGDTETLATTFEDGMLAQTVRMIVDRYSPVHEDVLCKEAAASGVVKARDRKTLDAKVVAFARNAYATTREATGDFFWKPGDGPEHIDGWREDRSAHQGVNETAMPLLRALAREQERQHGTRQPVRDMAKALGHSRLSQAWAGRLQKAWDSRNSQ